MFNFFSLFRAACPCFCNSQFLFEQLAPQSQIFYSLSSDLFFALKLSKSFMIGLFLEFNFRAFGILWSLSIDLLLILKLSSFFRAVCSYFWNSLVIFERFAPGFQFLQSFSTGSFLLLILSSFFRAVCFIFSMFPDVFDVLWFNSSSLFFFRFYVLFRAECSFFSNILVSDEIL